MQPRLIETIGSFNLVDWNGRCYGFPHGIAFDFTKDDINTISDAIVEGKDSAEVKALILNKYRSFIPHKWGLEDAVQEHSRLDELGLPEVIEIEPIHSCNLRCVMCHVPYEKLSKKRIDVPTLLRQMKGLEGRWVILGSSYEPTVHPDFVRLANGLSELGFKLNMCTNGSLFSDKLIANIRGINLKSLVLSFDGATKKTYESIRDGAKFDQVLERIGNLKTAFGNKATYFSVNQTLMRSNIEEVCQSVELWERMGFDHLGLIHMRIRAESKRQQAELLSREMDYANRLLDKAALRLVENNYQLVLSSPGFRTSPLRNQYPQFFAESVVHSDNPLYRVPVNPGDYFQNGAFPGMSVPCRSPFKYAKIGYDGNVILCCRFTIGNIYEEDFKDIWFGEVAQNLRRSIVSTPGFCETCDYYRFCIKAGEIDLSLNANFFASSNILSQEDAVRIQSGTLLRRIAGRLPPSIGYKVRQMIRRQAFGSGVAESILTKSDGQIISMFFRAAIDAYIKKPFARIFDKQE